MTAIAVAPLHPPAKRKTGSEIAMAGVLRRKSDRIRGMRHPLTFRHMARLLLLSVLFQAFLVSGAFARLEQGTGPHRVQICAASGLQWVDLEIPAPPAGTSSSHHDHCALCGCLAVDLPASAHPIAIIPGFHPPFIAAHPQYQCEYEAHLLPPSRAPPAMF